MNSKKIIFYTHGIRSRSPDAFWYDMLFGISDSIPVRLKVSGLFETFLFATDTPGEPALVKTRLNRTDSIPVRLKVSGLFETFLFATDTPGEPALVKTRLK